MLGIQLRDGFDKLDEFDKVSRQLLALFLRLTIEYGDGGRARIKLDTVPSFTIPPHPVVGGGGKY